MSEGLKPGPERIYVAGHRGMVGSARARDCRMASAELRGSNQSPRVNYPQVQAFQIASGCLHQYLVFPAPAL